MNYFSVSHMLGNLALFVFLPSVFCNMSLHAQVLRETPKIVQPSLGYNDIGTAQIRGQTLRVQFHEWKETKTKKEVDEMRTVVQSRTGRKPQMNPKTGKEEMMEFAYDVAIPMMSKKEIETTEVVSSKTIVKDYTVKEFSVCNLEGKSVEGPELLAKLSTPKTVLVHRARYLGEPFPQINEQFRALLHPGLLIVRVNGPELEKAAGESKKQ